MNSQAPAFIPGKYQESDNHIAALQGKASTNLIAGKKENNIDSHAGEGYSFKVFGKSIPTAIVKPTLIEKTINENHMNENNLENFWTLWYLQSDPLKLWEESLNEITTFGTVEDFWGVYNHIKPPSELSTGENFSFFKRGVRPMWQAADNIQGGSWNITLPKTALVRLNSLWLDILLLLIGETLGSGKVFGVVFNVRFRCNKISIWTAPGLNAPDILSIATQLRNTLALEDLGLKYHLHKDCMIKKSSTVPIIHEM